MGGYTGINLLVFLSVQSSFKLIQGGCVEGGEDTLELTCQSFCLSKCLSRLYRVGGGGGGKDTLELTCQSFYLSKCLSRLFRVEVGRLHWNYLVSLSVCPSVFQGYSGFRGG